MCDVLVSQGRVQAEFLVNVTKGKGEPLLSKDTVMKVVVLRIGVDIAKVAETDPVATVPRSV